MDELETKGYSVSCLCLHANASFCSLSVFPCPFSGKRGS